MIEIPLRIISVQNEKSHWSVRGRRVRAERDAVGWSLHGHDKPALPCTVTLTRVAPRPLDSHDNLRYGLKPSVDAISEWLGIKDNDSRVTWAYAQAKGKPKEYAVQVEFT